MVYLYYGGDTMLRYKFAIMPALKAVGYSSTRLRREGLLGEGDMTLIRRGEICSKAKLDLLCKLLSLQPGDILEYIPDAPDDLPED